MKTRDPRAAHGALAVAACLAVLVSWHWGYRPAWQSYARDTAQLRANAAHIEQLEAMVAPAGGETAWFVDGQERLIRLKQRFPPQEQMPHVIDAVVQTLNRGDITIANVTQDRLQPAEDAGQPLLVDGRPCFRLPLTVTARGRYYALLDTLGRLVDPAFPGVVRIEQIVMQRHAAEEPALEATVRLDVYVTGRL